ncbi:NADH-ubiquinone oxidoreductase 78 kDa subunit [Ramicandelaber brevisporus]|nr:NADH-ubiquinone oxidoreductase 78 kDa subunit [Ramicandelaber brevisporus]
MMLQNVLRAARAGAASSNVNTASNALRKLSTSRVARDAVEVFVNGKPVQIERGSAVIQACEAAGVDIPRFCYHDRLSVAGNCRMCLVELERAPKPIASCAYPVTPGMKILTDTPNVKKAREGVMEFLLANHPLDCPVCDQGGECDLQDQSMRYGSDRGRFTEPTGKRAVEDKNFGPLIKTSMNRCIHCTRCVRFANEVAGITELGTSGRGNDMQIGTYIEKVLDSEMSANVIDLCPVGALTSKPYAFKARPWELQKTESIDVLDAVGSNIRIDSRGLEVMRVMPRLNEDINEEWISDKTRYACDGLKTQRLTVPLIRKGDSFVPASWSDALSTVASRISTTAPENMTAVAGSLADAEAMVALKDLFNRFNSDNLTVDGPAFAANGAIAHSSDVRSNYLFNSAISGIDRADVVLLVGTNPRHEAAIINARIRKAYLHNNLTVGLVGAEINTTFGYDHIGTDAAALKQLASGKHAFSKVLAEAKNPMIIVGSGIAEQANAAEILASVNELALKHEAAFFRPDWNGVNTLQRAAGRAAAFDIGYSAAPVSEKLKSTRSGQFIYLLGADDISAADIPQDAFVVYQGHHGDNGAHLADVILPGAAYTEKTATYINTEGRAQLARAAVNPPEGAREDWKVIRALSELAGVTLPYDDALELRQRMYDVSPTLVHLDDVAPVSSSLAVLAAKNAAAAAAKSGGKNVSFEAVVKNFYMTDPISRASSTMAKCTASFVKGKALDQLSEPERKLAIAM